MREMLGKMTARMKINVSDMAPGLSKYKGGRQQSSTHQERQVKEIDIPSMP